MSIEATIRAELGSILPRHNPPTEAQAFAYVELLLTDLLRSYKGVSAFADGQFPVGVVANSVTPGDFAFVYAFKDENGTVQHAHFLTRILVSENGLYRFKRLDTWTDHGGVVPQVNVPEEPQAKTTLEFKEFIQEQKEAEARPAEAPAPEQPKGKGKKGRKYEPEVRTMELRPEEKAAEIVTLPHTGEEAKLVELQVELEKGEASPVSTYTLDGTIDAIRKLNDQAAADPEGSVTVTYAEESKLADGQVLTNDEPEQSE